MTTNAKIGVFMDFFGNFELRDTFQEWILRKSRDRPGQPAFKIFSIIRSVH